MGARTFGAFAAGFAVGVMMLGAALWSSGSVKSSVLPPWVRARVSQTLPAPPANLNANAQLPAPPVPPPEGAPMPPAAATAGGTTAPTAATSQGSAERAATEPGTITPPPALHLAMPIEGIKPSELSNSFHDMRDGHQHEALDIPASRNTPVHAVAEGNVAKLFTSKQGGLTVYQFDNAGQYAFYYAHLDHYAKGLKEGMLLRTGDVLGYVGTTGDAPPNAPHLHFTVFKLGPDKKWWQGTALDPLPMLK